MVPLFLTPRRAAAVDRGAAILSGVLFILCSLEARREVQETIQQFGRNVDSGQEIWELGLLYFAPLTLLFYLAYSSLSRGWRVAGYFHWLAVAYAAVPLAYVGAILVAAA